MTAASDVSRFRIAGMDCAACAAKIETATRRVTGVEDVRVSLTAGAMVVRHAEADLDEVQRRVVSLGYDIKLEDRGAASSSHRSDAAGPTPPARPHHDSGDEKHDHGDGDHDHDHRHSDHDADHSAPGTHAHFHQHPDEDGKPFWATRRFQLAAAAGGSLVVAFAIGKLFPATEHWPFIVAMFVGLIPIARRAIAAARYGTPFSIEMLMTVAALGAVFIGAGEEAATVVFLFLVGELLEGIAAGRARASIKALARLIPKTAHIERNGVVTEIDAEHVAVSDTILVRPGDRIPADGAILEGESALNEAPVTGESVPVRKKVGDRVFAGTINGDGLLRVRVTAAAADNTIARIIKLVEEAQESKAPTERMIDRFSRWYTPGVMAVAAIVAVLPPLFGAGTWNEWIYKGLAILLIGCPCALVISTPAAIASALASGARRGLLMKGGAVLERLGDVTLVAFDKTGTLTAGRPEVTDIVAFRGSDRDVLEVAAALDAGSSHPLALAILKRAEELAVKVATATGVAAIGGQGVSGRIGTSLAFLGSPQAAQERGPLTTAQQAAIKTLSTDGKSIAVVVRDRQTLGAIALRDEPRSDAIEGLRELADRRIGTLMLTGDNRTVASVVGKRLGIPVRSELLPKDKQNIVKELQSQGHVVAKVGDGINDAPALAAADVGIAMGGGTDVALETADAAILHGRVKDVRRMIDLSLRTKANIRQNIGLSLGLKAVFLVTTVVGLTGLWPAILADTGATVLVTLNALRLLRAGDA